MKSNDVPVCGRSEANRAGHDIRDGAGPRSSLIMMIRRTPTLVVQARRFLFSCFLARPELSPREEGDGQLYARAYPTREGRHYSTPGRRSLCTCAWGRPSAVARAGGARIVCSGWRSVVNTVRSWVSKSLPTLPTTIRLGGGIRFASSLDIFPYACLPFTLPPSDDGCQVSLHRREESGQQAENLFHCSVPEWGPRA